MRNARLLIAENVKRLRLSLNLTQEQVAARAEMPHRTYQNLEYGRSMPHSRNIEKLAKALGVSEAELFKDQRVPQPPPALSQTSISKMTPEELNAFTRAILENNKKLEAENAGIQYKQHQNVDSVDKSHIEALEKQVRELKEQLEKIHAARPEPKTEKERVLHLLDRIKNKDFGRIRLMLEETLRMYQEEEEELMLQKKTRA